MPGRGGPGQEPARPGAAQGADLRDASRGQRIQKVLAAAGVASRRDCEALVREGRVLVNGQAVTELPAWVNPRTDRIEVNGRLISAGSRPRRPGMPAPALAATPKVYVMLHKPRGVISTAHDDLGRRSVTDLVDIRGAQGPLRLFPVGRLDADSTGLMLLTNDGELANRLTHPRFGVTKEYLVSVKGLLSAEDLARLTRGIYLTHRKMARRAGVPAGDIPTEQDFGISVKRAALEKVVRLKQQVDRSRGDRTRLLITLREGQNREIRRLLARLGISVRKLRRVAIGPLRLGKLPAGHWRMLSARELAELRQASSDSK